MSDNVLEVDMTTLSALAEPIMKQGYPLLIMGRHGIGKSEFVKQIAENLNMEVIEMRPSVMAEGDLSGLPFKGDNYTLLDGKSVSSTRWSPPDWFLKACTTGVILFFDEADRGSMQVAQSLFQINDSRQLNGYKLHPDTRIVACVNGGRFGTLYQVREMDLAEFDRYAKIQLEPRVEEWLDWGQKKDGDGVSNVMPDIVSFFKDPENHRWLENTGNEIPEPGKIYPSRRSWTRYSKVLSSIPDFKAGVNDSNQRLARQIGASFVGIDAADCFVNFANSISRIVTPEAVFFKGRTDVLSTYTPMDHEDFMNRTFAAGIFNPENYEKVSIEVFNEYLKSVPAEHVPNFMMKLVSTQINNLVHITNLFARFFSPEDVSEYLEDLFFGGGLNLDEAQKVLNPVTEEAQDEED